MAEAERDEDLLNNRWLILTKDEFGILQKLCLVVLASEANDIEAIPDEPTAEEEATLHTLMERIRDME